MSHALCITTPMFASRFLEGENALMQPVADVRLYLATRKPQPDFEIEQSLFITLPTRVRAEVRALNAAFNRVKDLVKGRVKVQPACRVVICIYKDWNWHLNTFRARFDDWRKTNDWVALVNCSKAGPAWQKSKAGLPCEFLTFCAARMGKYKRGDAKKEALRSIKRQWQTGRNMEGHPEEIKGYGFAQDWFKKNFPGRIMPVEFPYPDGWHYSNIMRQIKARNIFPKAVEAFLLQGTAAAKEFVPQTRGTRENLRFLEEVQFDDVKTDWRIYDPNSGQMNDLWLLIARDRATGLLLGFGMRPARAREDGSQEHLKLRDMKQLCGWLLERYGLPPYECVWKIERGTATLSQGSARALQEMLPGRIRISFSSMIGGDSPAGYFERRIGNSKGKASLESHNRGMHIIGAALPGQTGPKYELRPADLAAREKECALIVRLSGFLPEHLRGELGFSLLDLDQARQALFQIFSIQNRRDDHDMEGFRTILEWYDEKTGRWMPQNTAPDGVQVRRRKEMPVERAAWLVQGIEEWTRVSPEIITAFYDHTQRPVIVGDDGEITFRHEGKELVFANPAPSKADRRTVPGTKLLAYHHPDEPTFLHLTSGDGAIVGTWLLKNRAGDKEAVSQAIKYSAHAMKEAREHAEELAAPERERLDGMRARNCEILKGFVEVTPAEMQRGKMLPRGQDSPVAKGLAAVTAAREEKQEARREAGARAADAILSSQPEVEPETPASTAGDDLLNALCGER